MREGWQALYGDGDGDDVSWYAGEDTYFDVCEWVYQGFYDDESEIAWYVILLFV